MCKVYQVLFLFVLLLSFHGVLEAQQKSESGLNGRLRDCDLLFQVSDVPNVITEVTRGVDGLKVEHVGVFVRTPDGAGAVIEALPGRGVIETPLADFLWRNTLPDGRLGVVAGRVSGRLHRPATLRNVRACLGCPYDSLYLAGNGAVYCSELVQTCFVNRCGKLIFNPIPMTFRDGTGQIPRYWTELYARHGMAVPEGEPGSNPGELSRRSNVEIRWELLSSLRP
ncbi:MAG: hypothetical protein NC388_00860 [Clostridium sp.]|nr:hypothetical protein [Clostridium sp.]